MKKSWKKILGVAGALTGAYTGVVHFFPGLHNSNAEGIIFLAGTVIAALTDPAKKPRAPKGKLPQ